MFYYFLDQIIVLTNTDSRLQSLPDYLVKHYKNLVLARADFANLVSNTPLSKIFQESLHTKYFLNNISDIKLALREKTAKVAGHAAHMLSAPDHS